MVIPNVPLVSWSLLRSQAKRYLSEHAAVHIPNVLAHLFPQPAKRELRCQAIRLASHAAIPPASSLGTQLRRPASPMATAPVAEETRNDLVTSSSSGTFFLGTVTTSESVVAKTKHAPPNCCFLQSRVECYPSSQGEKLSTNDTLPVNGPSVLLHGAEPTPQIIERGSRIIGPALRIVQQPRVRLNGWVEWMRLRTHPRMLTKANERKPRQNVHSVF